MERKYIAIIRGPKEYLPSGIKFEKLEITQDDIDEFLSEGDEVETEEDAITYYRTEYVAEWEQRWCSVQIMTPDEAEALYGALHNFLCEETAKEADNEEEEQEENVWEDWE